MRTVFFGPFIGEFGWEVTRWQGWVRRMLATDFQGCRAIVSSYPGRRVLYPDGVEFWEHPKEISEQPISQRNYITDGWAGDYPEVLQFHKKNLLGLNYYRACRVESEMRDVRSILTKYLEQCRAKLPGDTVYFVPWLDNRYAGLRFGVSYRNTAPRSGKDIVIHPLPYEEQKFEILRPSNEARAYVEGRISSAAPVAAIFPRMRAVRRPDKNWAKEKYEALIERLRTELGFTVALLGSPGGCYFAEGVPAGTVDFIRVPDRIRADIHAAAVQRADICLGSISGAIVFAAMCGGSALTWCMPSLQKYIYLENLVGSPVLCYPQEDPSVERILELSRSFLSSPDRRGFGLSFKQTGAENGVVGQSGLWRNNLARVKRLLGAVPLTGADNRRIT